MSKKKSGARSPRAESAAKKKPGKTRKAKARKPTPRQTNLIEGIIEGKSVRQAALAAGYSQSSADNPDELLNTQAVRIRLANLLAPIEKLAERVNEGLDAVQTDTFSHVLGSKLKGTEEIQLKHVDKIAWTERRKYIELAARFKGLLGFASDVPLQGMQPRRVLVEYVRADQMTTA